MLKKSAAIPADDQARVQVEHVFKLLTLSIKERTLLLKKISSNLVDDQTQMNTCPNWIKKINNLNTYPTIISHQQGLLLIFQ